MQPKNKTGKQKPAPHRTFIEQARRTQIIEATIEVLAEQGYLNTSFVAIAERAGISPGLISYHFKDKHELTGEVFRTVSENRAAHVRQAVAQGHSAIEKLQMALEADLANMGTRPKQFKALSEILFSMRSNQGPLSYMSDNDDPLQVILQDILQTGQKNGEMGKFDVVSMLVIIEGACGSFLTQMTVRPLSDLETFTKTMVTLVLSAVKK